MKIFDDDVAKIKEELGTTETVLKRVLITTFRIVQIPFSRVFDSSFKNEQDEAVQDDGKSVMDESERSIGVEEVVSNGDEIVTALILNWSDDDEEEEKAVVMLPWTIFCANTNRPNPETVFEK